MTEPPPSRLTRKTKWMLLLAGFPVGLLITFLIAREPTTQLTRDNLAAAEAHWKAANILNYDMRYRMHTSDYAVSIRDGVVTSLTVNGQDVTSIDNSNYSIEGLFRTLEMELENATSQSTQSPVMLRVRFNPQYGYIERYLRGTSAFGQPTSIELISFYTEHSSANKT